MKRIMIGALVSGLLLGTAAFAQEGKKGRIERRQENQQDRIGKGVQDGSLTPGEAARLEKGEARLDRKIERDRKDGGGLDAKERRQIERRQDNLSKRINKQRHDKQTRK